MSDDNFSVEESEALLHAIFPNYPDIHEIKPVPENGAFLRALRAGEAVGNWVSVNDCDTVANPAKRRR
jgi:hypothetical protein